MSSYLAVVGHEPARLHEWFYLAGRELHHKRVVNAGIRCELVIPGWRGSYGRRGSRLTIFEQCQTGLASNQFVTNFGQNCGAKMIIFGDLL